MSSDLQSDKEIVLAAVKKNGLALGIANDVFKSDKKVVTSALENNDEAMQFVSKDLLNF